MVTPFRSHYLRVHPRSRENPIVEVSMDGVYLDEVIKDLQNGESLESVASGMKNHLYEIAHLYFAMRMEVRVDGENYYSEKGFLRVGPLFVPEDLTVSRIDLINYCMSAEECDAAPIRKVLELGCGADQFYQSRNSILPVGDDVFVLKSHQL